MRIWGCVCARTSASLLWAGHITAEVLVNKTKSFWLPACPVRQRVDPRGHQRAVPRTSQSEARVCLHRLGAGDVALALRCGLAHLAFRAAPEPGMSREVSCPPGRATVYRAGPAMGVLPTRASREVAGRVCWVDRSQCSPSPLVPSSSSSGDQPIWRWMNGT